METTIRVRHGVQFSAESRGHVVVCDQPRENGGDDEGMTPPELLLSSLGACAAFYVVQYLKFQRLASENLAVRVEADKAKDPPRIGSFRVLIEHPAASDPRHAEGMRRATEKCLIHNTLLQAPAIVVETHALEPVIAAALT